MIIKLDVLIVQIIHVMILVFVFKKIIGSRLTDALVQRLARQQKIDQAEAYADQCIAKAESQAKNIIAEAQVMRKKILADAECEAQKRREDLLADAEREVAYLKEEARIKLMQEKDELEKSFTFLVRKTALLALRKIGAEKAVEEAYLETVVTDLSRNS